MDYKVAIFTSGNRETLQDDIDQFIDDKDVIDIKFSTAASSRTSSYKNDRIISNLFYSVLITYKEIK